MESPSPLMLVCICRTYIQIILYPVYTGIDKYVYQVKWSGMHALAMGAVQSDTPVRLFLKEKKTVRCDTKGFGVRYRKGISIHYKIKCFADCKRKKRK